MLERVGLMDRLNHYPTQLSGGEMQRVAIARASVISPSILFADEPTGNLDSGSGERVIDLLMEQRKQCTLVLVTHNPELARLADREIRLMDGRIDEIVLHRKAKGRSGGERAKKGQASAGKARASGPGGRPSSGPANQSKTRKSRSTSSGEPARRTSSKKTNRKKGRK